MGKFLFPSPAGVRAVSWIAAISVCFALAGGISSTVHGETTRGLRDAVQRDDTAEVDRLLAATSPAQHDQIAASALMAAVYYGKIALADHLLNGGVPATAADARGWTALMAAVKGDQLKAVDLLMTHGADPEARPLDGGPSAATLASDLGRTASLTGKGAEAAALFSAHLPSAAPGVILLERQELDKALGEQELSLSGTVAPETAAKVGALTGAKVLVTGRLFETGSKYFLVAKIIGTETSRVYSETANISDLGALDKAAAEVAAKIGADLTAHADTLVAREEDPGARVERLKKLVDGKTLPSVSVVIAEQHIGQFIIDPAAQTEMKLILQQIGCEVIDPAASGKQADVQITGEAFSEAAGRHGNLFSDRARVEIKAVRPANGKLLLADRQSDVAVDVAENIAGKTALQNAAGRLLDRIVPKLVEP